MIQVIYYADHNRLTVEGHARAGEPGQDLVCAGASALAHTLATNVRVLNSRGCFHSFQVVLEPGNSEISAAPRPNYKWMTKLVFETVAAGFAYMAQESPDYISFEKHGGRG